MLIYFQTFTRPIWPTFRIQNDWGLNRVLWWTTASQCSASRAVPSSSSTIRSTPRPKSLASKVKPGLQESQDKLPAPEITMFNFHRAASTCTVVSQLDIISPYSWPTVPQNLKCKMGLSLAGGPISLLTVSFQSCQCTLCAILSALAKLVSMLRHLLGGFYFKCKILSCA